MTGPDNRAVVRLEGEAIVITVGDEYWIYSDQCDTPEKILAWVHHLGEKSWATREIICSFVEVAALRIRVDLTLPRGGE